MAKEEIIPVTLVTGLSDNLKSSLIKEIKVQKQSKVILFQDNNNFSFEKIPEELLQEKKLTEAVHDLVTYNKNELLSVLNDQQNKKAEQLIVDLDKVYAPDMLSSFMEEDSFLGTRHIHVIDAVSFWFHYSSIESVENLSSMGNESQEFTLGELLIFPLEKADTIILGNADQVSKERLAELNWFLGKLNPLAEFITMADFKRGVVPGEKDIGRKRTPYELYTYQLQHFEQKKPFVLVGEYGIDTYIYRSSFPVSMERLEKFFQELPEGTLRTKAVCYIPQEEQTHFISQIGPSVEIITEEKNYNELTAADNLSEFLFIGDHLDPLTIKKGLDSCLLNDAILTETKLSK